MTEEDRSNQKGPAPWLFLFGTLAWTWTWLTPAMLSDRDWLEFPVTLLSAIGLLGPLIMPALLIGSGRWDFSLDATIAHFYRRCIDIQGLGKAWTLGVVGLAIVLAFGPLLLNPSSIAETGLIDAGPVIFLLVGLLGALEEPGWRGYGQEALQRRIPVLLASFIIGIFWAAWHLPLFFIDGTYQDQLGVGTTGFWAFHAAIILSAPFYAWLYNAARKIIFAVVLYHGLGNVARELAPEVTTAAALTVEGVMTLFVVILSWRWISQTK